MKRRITIIDVNREKNHVYVALYAYNYDKETGWGYDGKGDGVCNHSLELDDFERFLGIPLPEGDNQNIEISIDLPDELENGSSERLKKKYGLK